MPAIKLRYGAYSDFVPSKLLPAEVGVVQSGDPNTTDGVAIYICAINGTVKRFTTSDDLTDALTDLLDDTLSVQDKAAEAAAVGTAIQALTAQVTSIESEITGIESDLTEVTEVDAGTVDKSTGVKLAAYINSTATKMASDVNCMLVYFPCLPNVTYTINKMLSARFRVGYTTVTPANNVQIFGGVADNTATSISIATGSNAQYLVVYYYDSANDTLSETEIYNSLAISYRGEMSAVDKVARADKVDKQQSVADAGKAMIVGDDGVLAPTEIAGGLSDEAKVALLNCFAHVAWTDEHGQRYYDTLEAALYAESYPKITAQFNPGLNVIYTDDTLDSLKQYLTVKYYETKESAGTVIASANYTLSGVLTEGASTILVSYSDLITSFVIDGVVDFYNIHEWIYPGRIQIQQQKSPGYYTPTGASIGSLGVYEYSNNIRMCLTTGKGKYPYIHRLNGTLYNFYPIPVPNDAVSATLTWNSSDINMGISQWKYATDPTRYYQQGSDSGWQTSPYTYTLPTNDNNRFVSVNIRNTSNTDISASQIPTEITLTFNVN